MVKVTKHHAMKAYWRIGGVAPLILYLGTKWRWVVSFTPRPLYPPGKSSEPFWTRWWRKNVL